jgi:hypothetical protein
MALDHAPASHSLVLDNAEIAVLLAVFFPNRMAQEHAAELAATNNTANGIGLDYGLFCPFAVRPGSCASNT